jgi:hypothetical protein
LPAINCLAREGIIERIGKMATAKQIATWTRRVWISLTAILAVAMFSSGSPAYALCGGCVAFGAGALPGGTGVSNSAFGLNALHDNTTGTDNTAIGTTSLYSNTNGGDNTASGSAALFDNTSGQENTAVGSTALQLNIGGSFNTANGSGALRFNSGGNYNTADGSGALNSNTGGTGNTASGLNALVDNTCVVNQFILPPQIVCGNFNSALGYQALANNTSGSKNIAIGVDAGESITTGSDNIDIYDQGTVGDSNIIRIGTVGTQDATFIAGISGTSVSGSPVCVDDNGQLGTCPTLSQNELQGQARKLRQQAEQIGELEQQMKKKDAQIDVLAERLDALEQQARISGPERLASANRSNFRSPLSGLLGR